MNEQKTNALSRKVLKLLLLEKGVEVSNKIPNAVIRTAKVLGIKHKEAREFAKDLLRELVEDAFADGAVSPHAKHELGEALGHHGHGDHGHGGHGH